uniref:Peroxidase n=1 Tax=Fagus sylvatica TaxID=28930 RepID=A0A2N9EYK7_FAGSY
MELMRKMSFLIFLLCFWISLKNQNAEPKKGFTTARWSSSVDSSLVFLASSSPQPMVLSSEKEMLEFNGSGSLEYDFYRNLCPQAEQIVRAVVQLLHEVRSDVASALLRLVFHDCFIEGCDASVLLDAAEGIDSEKESPPNETLKGFDVINIIKLEIEEVCPGVVSCADILVLAARDRESSNSFLDLATNEIPSPHDDLSQTLASFASRGFDERETVTLLGAHSIGVTHCKFFQNRLYNFSDTDKPDPSVDTRFLNLMRSRCNSTHTSSSSSSATGYSSGSSLSSSGALSNSHEGSPFSSPEEPGMAMDYEGPGSRFGTLYYRSLLQGRGLLYADQQLMAGKGTGNWVKAYASHTFLFRRDFALAMMKLSNHRVLTASMGHIRLNC